jgi:hypothetical protein
MPLLSLGWSLVEESLDLRKKTTSPTPLIREPDPDHTMSKASQDPQVPRVDEDDEPDDW